MPRRGELALARARALAQGGRLREALGALEAAWFATSVAAVYHGVARSALDWLVRWLRQRVPSNLGAPLATLPRFQSVVGEYLRTRAAERSQTARRLSRPERRSSATRSSPTATDRAIVPVR